MKPRVLRGLLLAAVFLAAVASGRLFAGRHSAALAGPQQEIPVGTRVPVLVELFTSEGCSSCPPADQLLARFVEKQPVEGAEIVALEQHVDYWNRLGWTDPYSSADFTQRQSQYADALGLEGAYTPQMVIDGRAEFVGNDERRAREAIAQAAHLKKAFVHITRDEKTGSSSHLSIAVRVEGLATAEPADAFLAVTEDRISNAVSRGENAGRQLTHSSLTRSSRALGEIKPGAASFSASTSLAIPADWRRENLRVVAYVQERKSRRILGVSATTLAQIVASPAVGQSR
jgi:hypothetical protein